MNIQARKRLLQYFETKASPQTFRILRKFFRIIDQDLAGLEVSSESGQGGDRDYVRLALSCLRRDQVLELFSETKHKQQAVKQFMPANHEDPCFGMGIADYGLGCDEQRIKLYNYYDLADNKTLWKEHLLKLCRKTKIPWQNVERDINYFKKVKMSAVDFYDHGAVELKVYYGPFRSQDILLKFQSLFNAQAIRKYGEWLMGGHLPRLALLCIRYNLQGKSVRTDFWCSTKRVMPYLKEFDLQGDAVRLYKDLQAISQKQVLTFMCIDMDQRPRMQFYFLLG